jgi:hypothetical protein
LPSRTEDWANAEPLHAASAPSTDTIAGIEGLGISAIPIRHLKG